MSELWSSGYGLSFRSNRKSHRPTSGTWMRGYGDSVGISVWYKRRRRMTEGDERRKEEESETRYVWKESWRNGKDNG